MKYSNINFNDVVNGSGVNVSVYLQGCPHHCAGCFNPETWDFFGGQDFTVEVMESILTGLTANGVRRNLSILGGEPLCQENLFLTNWLVNETKKKCPEAKIYIWTGYLYEDLLDSNDFMMKNILSKVDVIVDGPYIEAERDITLPLRGSRNQRVIELTK
jgi:anaerobic ribonucleoside-triphosphate reductase activating protein